MLFFNGFANFIIKPLSSNGPSFQKCVTLIQSSNLSVNNITAANCPKKVFCGNLIDLVTGCRLGCKYLCMWITCACIWIVAESIIWRTKIKVYDSLLYKQLFFFHIIVHLKTRNEPRYTSILFIDFCLIFQF